MQFWKKYKAKKELKQKLEKAKEELKQKLEKARFINFYGHKIDLDLGEIMKVIRFNNRITTEPIFGDEYMVIDYYIQLVYKNFIKKSYFICTDVNNLRDNYALELLDFINSEKFTERLKEYQQLKNEYEQL
jgi:hypothetical protein